VTESCPSSNEAWLLTPHLRKGQTPLVVTHASAWKALLSLLDPHVVTENVVPRLKGPNTTPLVYTFQPAASNDSSEIIPGGLAIIPYSNKQGQELRYQLRGQWLEG
jgi:hypothetical protein